MIYYLIGANVFTFMQMKLDKSYAIKKKNRISEKALFTGAIAGGAIGSIAGMYTFRHKTKHKQFTIGMPLILLTQIIIATYFN